MFIQDAVKRETQRFKEEGKHFKDLEHQLPSQTGLVWLN